MQSTQTRLTQTAPLGGFSGRTPLESRLLPVHFQVYRLTESSGRASFGPYDPSARTLRCVPQELAAKLAHAPPQEGEPYKVHHDAFGCPAVATHRVFSADKLGTGELVLTETYKPGAVAYFVEVAPVIAVGPPHRPTRALPTLQSTPQPSQKAEEVQWVQGTVLTGRAFQEKLGSGRVGDWTVVYREESKGPLGTPGALKSRRATTEEIEYAKRMGQGWVG